MAGYPGPVAFAMADMETEDAANDVLQLME